MSEQLDELRGEFNRLHFVHVKKIIVNIMFNMIDEMMFELDTQDERTPIFLEDALKYSKLLHADVFLLDPPAKAFTTRKALKVLGKSSDWSAESLPALQWLIVHAPGHVKSLIFEDLQEFSNGSDDPPCYLLILEEWEKWKELKGHFR